MSDDNILCRAPLVMMILLIAASTRAYGENSGDVAVDAGNDVRRSSYTTAQIAAMFKRPTNVTRLLRNLKIVVDRDLLLQPGLSDDAVLMKLFAGAGVKHVKVPDTKLLEARDSSVSIDDRQFPGMTVSLRQGKNRVPEGLGVKEHETRFGWIEINGASIPNFTVAKVHDVFGDRSSDTIDYGFGTDGATYVPTQKGTIVYSFYRDPTATPRPPYSRLYGNRELTFNIKLDAPTENGLRSPEHRTIHSTDEIESLRILVKEH